MSSLGDRHREHRRRHGRPGEEPRVPIWARPEPGRRRPRYSREQIAEVAVAIADGEGFEAVAMRRVAAELGASPMSLYHYLDGKEDLIALMDDALMAETLLAASELPGDWRQAVAAIARRTRDVYLRHPWALAALHGEKATPSTPIAPHSWAHFEQSLAALDGAPLTILSKLDLLATVDDLVTGHALRAGEIAIRRRTAPEPAEAARTFGEELLRTGRFPHIAEMAGDPDADALAASILDEGHLAEQFERGLRLLLDGWTAGG
ncbi:MAG: TetR/AcrR family transcriptional regulator [Candidatus Dormibacteraceae bacterium]